MSTIAWFAASEAGEDVDEPTDGARLRRFGRWLRRQFQFQYVTRSAGLYGLYLELRRNGQERPFTLLLLGVMILGGEVVGQVVERMFGDRK